MNERAKTEKAASVIDENKQTKRTLKSIIATINENNSDSNSDKMSSTESENETSTIEFAHKLPLKTPLCYSMDQVEILQTYGNYTFAAHFESDEFLQKILNLMKTPDSTKINRLPAPWREKFRCFSRDSNDYIYMDERLVVPKALRPIILRSLHYGHPGRDSMLAIAANVWWPRLHRDVVGLAKHCQQCQASGKNIKPMHIKPMNIKPRQKGIGHLPKCIEINQEIAKDLAGSFQDAINARKYLLVSVDHSNGWSEAKFLRLRANKKIITQKDLSGLSEILFALRMNPSANKKSLFKRYTGQEPNTIKSLVTNHPRSISEHPEFSLTEEDFESGQDSTILVRERTKGSKLEGAYKKRRGVLLEQSNHSITFLTAGPSRTTVISKRDVGQQNTTCSSKWRQPSKLPVLKKMAEHEKTATSDKQSKITTTSSSQSEQNQRESTDQAEMTGINDQARKNQTTALASLKQKMRKRLLVENSKRTKRQKQWIEQNTIQTESEGENEEINQNPEKSEGERREDEDQQRKNNQQVEHEVNNPVTGEQNENRRSQRHRNKPNFFGNNVMVTQVSRLEDIRESSPEY